MNDDIDHGEEGIRQGPMTENESQPRRISSNAGLLEVAVFAEYNGPPPIFERIIEGISGLR